MLALSDRKELIEKTARGSAAISRMCRENRARASKAYSGKESLRIFPVSLHHAVKATKKKQIGAHQKAAGESFAESIVGLEPYRREEKTVAAPDPPVIAEGS